VFRHAVWNMFGGVFLRPWISKDMTHIIKAVPREKTDTFRGPCRFLWAAGALRMRCFGCFLVDVWGYAATFDHSPWATSVGQKRRFCIHHNPMEPRRHHPPRRQDAKGLPRNTSVPLAPRDDISGNLDSAPPLHPRGLSLNVRLLLLVTWACRAI